MIRSSGSSKADLLLQVQVYNYIDRQGNGKDLVEANIVVEREAHRPIILGREGSALKKLSTAARLSMENFLGELALLSAEPWLIRLRHSIITSSTFWASGVQCPC